MLEEWNTAIAAKKIVSLLGCDVFELECTRSYPSDYYGCIEQAKQKLMALSFSLFFWGILCKKSFAFRFVQGCFSGLQMMLIDF